MASSVKRERQLARERYERQQAKRASTRARKRQLQQIAAVVTAVVAVIGGMAFLTTLQDDEPSTPGASSGSPSASASASASPEASGASPSASSSDGHGHACTYARSPEKAAKDVGIPTYDEATAHTPFTATVKTNQGDLVIAMDAEKAPCTTNSFKHLASKGYFTKTSCHRLTTEGLFVLQCGDPTGSGGGGPGYGFGIENAPADGKYPAGAVAMARSQDPNSNGSQFFLVYKDSQLPTDGGGYSIFGRVSKGLDVVQKVADAGVQGGGGDGPPAAKVTIESVQLGKG